MKRRLLLALAGLLALVVIAVPIHRLTISTSDAGASDRNDDHETLVHRGATTCGVERWSIKTGIDKDARKVNTSHPVGTNISYLRALPYPSNLPLSSRIKPTETTVYTVQGYLLRYKIESDSDFHLVLADSGGRTMIVEIPSPACVGSSSPFLHQISYVRSTFTSRYHPTKYFQRVHTLLTVSGVGFFDFKHGQSGVAPNAIELHPVLAIRYGGALPPAPPTVKPRPRPTPSGTFTVAASVSPNRVGFGDTATLTAQTAPGARCRASVTYSTGRHPKPFNDAPQTVGSSGTVSWKWTVGSKGSGGSATVTCSKGSASKSATAYFDISR